MPRATVLAVNVGRPREVAWQGRIVRTAIFKRPVAGGVRVRSLNLEGDAQADPDAHGGEYKAVYAYPSEHYAAWRAEVPLFGWGSFGENLTLAGITEDGARIGDRLRVGAAELVVTQPRLPCYKLALRFGVPDMEARFLESGRTGFYLSVAVEGRVSAGAAVELVAAAGDAMTVAEVVSLYRSKEPDPALLRRASELAALPEGLRARFRRRLGAAGGSVPAE